MTQKTAERLIIAGFAMAYVGAIGLLLLASSEIVSGQVLAAIRLTLGALAGGGAILLTSGHILAARRPVW